MEGGGRGFQSAPAPTPAAARPPQSPTQPKAPTTPVKPVTTAKPVPVPVVPATQPPKPSQPQQPKPNQGLPTQMDLKPVHPGKPGGSIVTTPGPGNVKQLVTFYDSHGKASVIRPYSYSDAVKKGQ
ncbi:Uncharacterized protein OBRU01_08641 [Operophtera brumata]|uniref:Uncharacterized protein n=1 Tax=Operophtera brumata TaxID=104452 RepID=A0A0L7LGS7_OPEBR|nr:Uncharacterized protein OBRU01_08641 [Operophtera brumata]